jgi:hypothetical protein
VDRGKQGTRRSSMTDGYGIPLDRVLAGATMETMREVDPLMSRETISVDESATRRPK